MSLRVWLPLNGNLNNQGLSDIVVTNSGATVDNNGKIGKCYNVNSNKKITFSSFKFMEMKPQNNFSLFLWVKGTTNGWLIACGAWELRLRPDYIQIHLNGDGRYPARYTASFDTNTWYHLGFTWSGSDGKLKLYLNGSEVSHSDVPSSANFDIYSTFGLPYDGPRYVNDLRIYDHCLSAKEVKEISKGLCLHYKLDNNGVGGKNLVSTLVKGGQTTLDGKYGLHTSTTNADTYFWAKLSEPVNNGDVVTVSCNVEGLPANGTWNFPFWGQNSGLRWDLHNGYNVGTFTCSGTSSQIMFDDNGASGFTRGAYPMTITNFKIERGSKATAWCPNETDELYSSLGLNSTIEKDCSGFGNDGTKVGIDSFDTNSARYEVARVFNGVDNPIQMGNMTTIVPDGIFTMNCWFYKTSLSSKSYDTIWGGPSGFEVETRNAAETNPVIVAWNWGKGQIPYEFNKWNMLTIVRASSEMKWYLNGELKLTTSIGSIPSGNYFVGAWRDSTSQNYKGNISDFRIYSTALSAEDIKELYQTSASIDKDKNLYCFELKQTDNQTSICKSGVAKMELLSSPTITGKCSGNQYTKSLKTWTNGSQLTLNDSHKIRVVFRSRGDGTPTSSKCSSIGSIVWEKDWKWSASPIYWYSKSAYNNIGKIVDYTGTFTVTANMVSTTTTIAVALFWIISNGWVNGNDGQTHELYYYKYWNNTTGEVYAEGGNPEHDRLAINDFIEI